MRAALFLLTSVALAGCYSSEVEADAVTYHANGAMTVTRDSPTSSVTIGRKPDPPTPAPPRTLSEATGGRIIDLSNSLSPPAGARLAALIEQAKRRGAGDIVVVIVPVSPEESLERLAWAVPNPKATALTLMVDSTSRRVRIEGNLAVEEKAAVARAMQADLAADRMETALARGIARLAA